MHLPFQRTLGDANLRVRGWRLPNQHVDWDPRPVAHDGRGLPHPFKRLLPAASLWIVQVGGPHLGGDAAGSTLALSGEKDGGGGGW